MPIFDYALLWAGSIVLAAAADQMWTRWLRPMFARRRGWPPLGDDEHIPAAAWAGGLSAIMIMFVLLPYIGVAAGY